jgi:hypothetical protein
MRTTPIVYIVFNRPKHTRQTFAAIRDQRPSTLFVIADGPREGDPTDKENCAEVRRIMDQIDWPCEVHRNYANQNLGCRQRVISGLDWVFHQVEAAIILEDDCLPVPDFYPYCESLLERYKDDDRVMLITGDNFQDGRRRGRAAYYFSKYPHIWGWATWRRAWQMNDPELSFWPEWKHSKAWRLHSPDPLERKYFAEIFDRMYRLEVDTWDYSWAASIWYRGGLTATPNANLVANIGLGLEATHTANNQDLGRATHPLGPLTHPQSVRQDRKADRYTFDHAFGGLQQRFHSRLLGFPPRIARWISASITGRATLG